MKATERKVAEMILRTALCVVTSMKTLKKRRWNMTRQRVITIGLLMAMALIGIRMGQRALPQLPAPAISFTCAVALNHALGEVCVRGQSGAHVSITITYCDGNQVQSPVLQHQTVGEYRWLWHVSTRCEGTAKALASAFWPDHTQSKARAVFSVG